MKTIWDDKVIALERQLKEYKELQSRTRKAQRQISIGVTIIDQDTGEEMRVSKIRNGSNDFEAISTVGGVGRGYSYLSWDWVLRGGD